MATLTLDRHIETTPDILGGKPRIAGHRISVQNVVNWHEHLAMSADEIATGYNLTLAEVYAALAYYYDHKAELDEQFSRDEEFIEAMRKATPSLVDKKLRERLA